MCWRADRWLAGALYSTHTWKVSVEREDFPTDCRSEVGVELMPAGALVRPL